MGYESDVIHKYAKNSGHIETEKEKSDYDSLMYLGKYKNKPFWQFW